MKRIAWIAMIGLLTWGTPAFAETIPGDGDFDMDGIIDMLDNCSERVNPMQDDTDADDCGNLCDADYDQSGSVGYPDFGFFTRCFPTDNPLCDHTEPIGDGGPKGFPDFGVFGQLYAQPPGPSGTTPGTVACP